jgi:flagellar FliL protein
MDDEVEVDEYTPKASKLPMIIAAVVALLVGTGGGFGASMMMGGKAEAADVGGDSDIENDDVQDDDTGEPENAITRLGKFTINLRGAAGGRILRFQVDVETKTEHQGDVERDMAILRDGVILLASDYTYADVDGLDGKLRLRDELLARLNTLTERPRVRRVFFTEFVVQ